MSNMKSNETNGRKLIFDSLGQAMTPDAAASAAPHLLSGNHFSSHLPNCITPRNLDHELTKCYYKPCFIM